MKFFKRAAAGVLAGVIGLSAMCFSVSAYGRDDEFPFEFNVGWNYQWGYIPNAQIRDADDTTVPWMVDFAYSAEGRGTSMQFFLLNNDMFNFDNYSDFKTIIQGCGIKYFHAYPEACNALVRIGARNNNYSTSEYHVAGYWDEETAYHPFDD